MTACVKGWMGKLLGCWNSTSVVHTELSNEDEIGICYGAFAAVFVTVDLAVCFVHVHMAIGSGVGLWRLSTTVACGGFGSVTPTPESALLKISASVPRAHSWASPMELYEPSGCGWQSA